MPCQQRQDCLGGVHRYAITGQHAEAARVARCLGELTVADLPVQASAQDGDRCGQVAGERGEHGTVRRWTSETRLVSAGDNVAANIDDDHCASVDRIAEATELPPQANSAKGRVEDINVGAGVLGDAG